MEQQTKLCTLCNRKLPLEAFSSKVGTVDNLQYRCRECYNRQQREYRASHPKSSKRVFQTYYRKNREQYLARKKKAYAQRNRQE